MTVITNLCFIIRDSKVMLIYKKRGFGNGVYNGPGGKKDEGETIEESVIREVREEVGVDIISPKISGVLTFRQAPEYEIEWTVHVFVCLEFSGELIETDEAIPHWFAFDEIPYAKMWADDLYWLPHILFGKYVVADFRYSKDWGRIVDYQLDIS